MKTRIRYRRARVTVDIDKPEKCEACGAGGRLECHHFIYAHKTTEVRKNPELATENTVWLCYKCHRLADMVRKLSADKQRTEAVIHKLMEKMGGDVNGEI